MHNVTVTYTATKGDSKVTEIFGHTFFDGKPETIEVDDRVLGKLQNHPQFTLGEGTGQKADIEHDPKGKSHK